jgi:hypothetical protein
MEGVGYEKKYPNQTLRRGASLSLIFANYGCAIGIIPIARAEFTIAPLLQVPPASRGEPRTGSVPPARRGNLKEQGY